MKRLNIHYGAAVFFAAINFYCSGFAQLDGYDARRRIGAEKQACYLRKPSPFKRAGKANRESRKNPQAGIAASKGVEANEFYLRKANDFRNRTPVSPVIREVPVCPRGIT